MPATEARNPKLEAEIVAKPDVDLGYLVYADWLQEKGDPRGELIVLQRNNKTAEATELLDGNAAHFWGKAADARDLLAPQDDWRVKYVQGKTEWYCGFLKSIWIANNFNRSGMHDGSLDEIDVADALGWLLDHASGQFVQQLTVGIVAYEDNSYDKIAKVIGARARPTLRECYLGDFVSEDTELNWSNAGDLSPMYEACPNLKKLTIRSGSMKLGAIDLPKLRELRVITGGFDRGSLASVCSAKWPVLDTLSLQLGRDTAFTVQDLAPIFDGTVFPKLRHLGLPNSMITDAICAALAGSRVAGQLESIDLSLGTMGEAGATALAAGSFRKLETLDVSTNYLTKTGLATLTPIAKRVVSDAKRRGEAQRDDDGDPDNRYIAAYE